MEVTIDAATASLPELLETVRSGEEVTLIQDGRAVARLVPVAKSVTKSGFRFGGLEHLRGTEPDFLEPMSEDELRLWEGGDEISR